ncbi:hypothetical protein DV515_00000518 [Chloebia gouldiae]|uniref:Uncharacterized protein n=1 Tax=Chloebia gouldiae TaxID=44316 RepID=A0A3L8T1E9_CHLGU|nr:hypothetical protein DV515_00000518 [Chloebia gouldiae]
MTRAWGTADNTLEEAGSDHPLESIRAYLEADIVSDTKSSASKAAGLEEGDRSHQQKASFEPSQSFKLEYSLGTHRANLRSKSDALISVGKLPTAAADATLAVLAAEEECFELSDGYRYCVPPSLGKCLGLVKPKPFCILATIKQKKSPLLGQGHLSSVVGLPLVCTIFPPQKAPNHFERQENENATRLQKGVLENNHLPATGIQRIEAVGHWHCSTHTAVDLGEALMLIQLLAWFFAVPQRNLHPAGPLPQPMLPKAGQRRRNRTGLGQLIPPSPARHGPSALSPTHGPGHAMPGAAIAHYPLGRSNPTALQSCRVILIKG